MNDNYLLRTHLCCNTIPALSISRCTLTWLFFRFLSQGNNTSRITPMIVGPRFHFPTLHIQSPFRISPEGIITLSIQD